jgi:hypothetical protein
MAGKPGRPTLLTPQVQKTFVKVIRESGFYRDACVAVDISEQTLARWRELGAKGEQPYSGFCEALRKAEVERRASYLRESKRRGAKKNDPREVQWRAAVTDPEQFSIKHHVVVQQQLDAALARLKEEFADEPHILERALSAIAGESRGTGAGGDTGEAGDVDAGGGTSVDADSLEAIATAAGVPRPRG